MARVDDLGYYSAVGVQITATTKQITLVRCFSPVVRAATRPTTTDAPAARHRPTGEELCPFTPTGTQTTLMQVRVLFVLGCALTQTVAANRFQQLVTAYHVLTKPESRAGYDRILEVCLAQRYISV